LPGLKEKKGGKKDRRETRYRSRGRNKSAFANDAGRLKNAEAVQGGERNPTGRAARDLSEGSQRGLGHGKGLTGIPPGNGVQRELLYVSLLS